MSIEAIATTKQKMVAVLRSEFALKQKFEKIEFEATVIKTKVEEFEDNLSLGKVQEFIIGK